MGNCFSQERSAANNSQQLSADIINAETESGATNTKDELTTSHHGLDIDAMKKKKKDRENAPSLDNAGLHALGNPLPLNPNQSSSVVAKLLIRDSVNNDELRYNEFEETNVDPVEYFHDDFYGQNEYILSPFLVKKHKITKQLSHIYFESKNNVFNLPKRLNTIESATNSNYVTANVSRATSIPTNGNDDNDNDDENENQDKNENERIEMDELNYKIPIIYCDWTASGKNLKCIENYIDTVVRPLYANTHTQTSVTGKQTTIFRNEARSMVLNSDSINGDDENDVLIFCGNGVTGAIFKLANILMKGKRYTPQKTVVFAGMYEHNSNLFIWKELGIKVIIIPEYPTTTNDNNSNNNNYRYGKRASQTNNSGPNLDSNPKSQKYGINTEVLEAYLKKYSNDQNYNLIIGSFSAASNVSGIIEKADEITDLLHKYNALSFWDYATGGPYLNMNMREKDAIFLSPHKFLGGPGCPGILICKKKLCTNSVPVVAGGGTVFAAYGIDPKQSKGQKEKTGANHNKYIDEEQTLLGQTGDTGLLFEKPNNADTSKYSQYEYFDVSTPAHIAEREEGGTPNIIGSIRCALVFLVKDIIGVERMTEIEHKYCHLFFKLMKTEIDNDILKIVGNTQCPRLPIVSFNVKYKNKLLHHNFIAALLNDLFGIQGRGGCSCAGMYGLNELSKQMKIDVNHMMDQLKFNDNELARYGYYRINFHYTLQKEEFDYIINCLKYICNHAWKFLALYDIDKKSGLYVHRSQMRKQENIDGKHRKKNGQNPNRLIYASLKDIKFQQHSKPEALMAGLGLGTSSVSLLKMESRTAHIIYDKVSNFDQCMQFANNVIAHMKDYLPSKEEIMNEENVNDDEQFYWLPSQLYDKINDACQNDGDLFNV